MPSYIHMKERVFWTIETVHLLNTKRSSGRMMTYKSCTDRRAWDLGEEERRKHLLDLNNSSHLPILQLGRYVPINVLIDVLMHNIKMKSLKFPINFEIEVSKNETKTHTPKSLFHPECISQEKIIFTRIKTTPKRYQPEDEDECYKECRAPCNKNVTDFAVTFYPPYRNNRSPPIGKKKSLESIVNGFIPLDKPTDHLYNPNMAGQELYYSNGNANIGDHRKQSRTFMCSSPTPTNRLLSSQTTIGLSCSSGSFLDSDDIMTNSHLRFENKSYNKHRHKSRNIDEMSSEGFGCDAFGNYPTSLPWNTNLLHSQPNRPWSAPAPHSVIVPDTYEIRTGGRESRNYPHQDFVTKVLPNSKISTPVLERRISELERERHRIINEQSFFRISERRIIDRADAVISCTSQCRNRHTMRWPATNVSKVNKQSACCYLNNCKFCAQAEYRLNAEMDEDIRYVQEQKQKSKELDQKILSHAEGLVMLANKPSSSSSHIRSIYR